MLVLHLNIFFLFNFKIFTLDSYFNIKMTQGWNYGRSIKTLQIAVLTSLFLPLWTGNIWILYAKGLYFVLIQVICLSVHPSVSSFLVISAPLKHFKRNLMKLAGSIIIIRGFTYCLHFALHHWDTILYYISEKSFCPGQLLIHQALILSYISQDIKCTCLMSFEEYCTNLSVEYTCSACSRPHTIIGALGDALKHNSDWALRASFLQEQQWDAVNKCLWMWTVISS